MNFANYQNLYDISTAISNKFTNRPETVELTQAQYDALTTAQKNDKSKVYYITDATGGGDSVQWTQTVLSGTKIAEITINGTTQNVYIPTLPQAESEVV